MKDSFKTNTKLLGLIGHPIKHTYSPYLHNVGIEMTGVNYVYLPFDVLPANLKNAVKGILTLGVAGVSVTLPHKETVIRYLNGLSEEASTIGAVNTIVNDLGKLQGYNTDAEGVYATLLPYKSQITGEEVSVIGAGGASRSVIYTLIRHFQPKKINLINRTEQRAEVVKEHFASKMRYDSFQVIELFPPDLVSVFKNSSLIVNATAIGMFPDNDDSITTLSKSFSKDQIVFDLVYNPPKTKLMQIAESEGAKTVDGLTMLIHQAIKSFELWTGKTLEFDKLYRALISVIIT
ncbi:MAG: shikimate dehydrogenase [Ignavibacteriales bacterium]|nr:shikimate dehydrogenase [Ignavibacteriales bacterium]